MILDTLAALTPLIGANDRLRRAVEFLRDPASPCLEPLGFGLENKRRIEICGDQVYAIVQRYQTMSSEHAFWEAHRRYAEVQFIVEGEETMGWAPLSAMQIVNDYDPERDLAVLRLAPASRPQFFTLGPGLAAIFFPGDAHMPGINAGTETRAVKKIVVKVAM
jgi:YhcH/YjgK/YiaL family protein